MLLDTLELNTFASYKTVFLPSNFCNNISLNFLFLIFYCGKIYRTFRNIHLGLLVYSLLCSYHHCVVSGHFHHPRRSSVSIMELLFSVTLLPSPQKPLTPFIWICLLSINILHHWNYDLCWISFI